MSQDQKLPLSKQAVLSKLLLDMSTTNTTSNRSLTHWNKQRLTCYQSQVTRDQFIWDKVFKNGPSKICGRQPLKNLKEYDLLSRPYSFKFFIRGLPHVLLGPFLDTLSHLTVLHIHKKLVKEKDPTQVSNNIVLRKSERKEYFGKFVQNSNWILHI